jgi:hypothetical protein
MSYRIEHRLGVPATADDIWDVFSDFSGWSAWCPIYPEASGRIAIGEKLTVTEAMPGRPQRVITPKVLDWVPREQLIWAEPRTPLIGGSIRYFEIEPLDKGCILSNGEIFNGGWVEGRAKKRRRELREAFESFNQALATRVGVVRTDS